MSMARLLYWGCDVWLNNPLRPLEACGTSGMKSALNGGLNLSIRDGWWDEWYDGENGWEIPTADGLADEDRRDDLEAAALYDLLRAFGRRRSSTTATTTVCRAAGWRWSGTRCSRWARRCRRPGWCATTPRSTTRRPPQSLRRTVEPDRRAAVRRGPRTGGLPAAGRARRGRKIADHRRRQHRAARHSAARVGADADRGRAAGRACGPTRSWCRPCWAGSTPRDALQDPAYIDMAHTGSGDGGTEIFSTTTPLPLAGSIGYTVRVLPHHPLLAGDSGARSGRRWRNAGEFRDRSAGPGSAPVGSQQEASEGPHRGGRVGAPARRSGHVVMCVMRLLVALIRHLVGDAGLRAAADPDPGGPDAGTSRSRPAAAPTRPPRRWTTARSCPRRRPAPSRPTAGR